MIGGRTVKKIVRQARDFIPTWKPRADFQSQRDYGAIPDDADYDDLRFSGEADEGEERGRAAIIVAREV